MTITHKDALEAKEAMADKTIPQDTLLPLLDAPLDELATYLAGDSWEARKNYLASMMRDSIMNLVKQLEVFKKHGTSESECRYILDGCLVGLHVKLGSFWTLGVRRKYRRIGTRRPSMCCLRRLSIATHWQSLCRAARLALPRKTSYSSRETA